MIETVLNLIGFFIGLICFVIWIFALVNYDPKNDCKPGDECKNCPFSCDDRKDKKAAKLISKSLTISKGGFSMAQGNKYDPRCNGSGYYDPTAYLASKHIEQDEKALNRVNRLINSIRTITDLAGFEIAGRISLRDKRTGKVWR